MTARDAAGNTGTDTLKVTYTPPDTTRPTVSITTPTSGSTYATGNSQLNIGGTASDNEAFTRVSWSNSRGGSGTCSGTSSWTKTGIALSSGQNVITVTATDAAGNYLDGSKAYSVTLPAGIPAKDFWSFVNYDPQTRSTLQTDNPYPSLNSERGGVEQHADGVGPLESEGRQQRPHL